MKITSSPNTTCSVSPTKKSVSFANTLKIRFSLALDDYSGQEYDACWYSSEEYQAIEKEMCRQFMKMEQGKALHDKKSCSRGLENYLTINAIAKRATRSEAFQAVLDEQARQSELCECDEEAIARLYNNVTSSCQMWATVLGRRDEREAEKYNQDDDNDDWDTLTSSQNYDWDDLTLSQASQESSIQQSPRIQQDHIAPQKSHEANATRRMSQLRQVAVSARTA